MAGSIHVTTHPKGGAFAFRAQDGTQYTVNRFEDKPGHFFVAHESGTENYLTPFSAYGLYMDRSRGTLFLIYGDNQVREISTVIHPIMEILS